MPVNFPWLIKTSEKNPDEVEVEPQRPMTRKEAIGLAIGLLSATEATKEEISHAVAGTSVAGKIDTTGPLIKTWSDTSALKACSALLIYEQTVLMEGGSLRLADSPFIEALEAARLAIEEMNALLPAGERFVPQAYPGAPYRDPVE